MLKKLIFVYNANSSIFSQATDYVHKIVSPSTYRCNLCAITYGNLGMRKDWKKFIDTLPFEVIFIHKDELKNEYHKLKDFTLPAVFIEDGENIESIISNEELDKQNDIKGLKDLVTDKLKDKKLI